MVKSNKNSCFKLLPCGGGGGDVAEKDNHHVVVSEIKDSNDKRGWSFRKRSARHRVLSNTVITETPSSEKKETSECTSINFQSSAEPNVVEKVCTTDFSKEKSQLSYMASSEVPETIVTESEGKVDVNLPKSVEGKVDANLPKSVEGKVDVNPLESAEGKVDVDPPESAEGKVDVDPIESAEGKVDVESAVVIIQAAIRGYLARRALIKHKNVVKLQAAVRGHLVRRNAVGTLRCVQAIVKMQLLVRSRQAQQSHSEDCSNHNDGKNDHSKTLDIEHHSTKSNVAHTSVGKLLNNKFARQLLESTPKNKPVRVKCDPSKADSAWKWLERWMTVSAKDSTENKKPICKSEQYDETKDNVFRPETGVPSEVILPLADSEPTVGDSLLPTGNEENTTYYDADNSEFQAKPASSPSLVKDDLEIDPPETTDDAKVASPEIDSLQIENMQIDASVPEDTSSLPQEPEIDGEQYKQPTKTYSSDQLETEAKQFVHGSRNSDNPAFFAAHSKFEEPSSIANSGRSSSLSNQDVSVESQADTSSAVTDTTYRSKELFSTKNSPPYPSKIGGSECGTELSISSTLESPERIEVENMEDGHDTKDLVEGTANPKNKIEHGVEANTPCAASSFSMPISDLNQSEIVNNTSGNIVDSEVPGNSKEAGVGPEKNATDLLKEQMETVSQDFKLSPEASPASHMTIAESQGTPSSQVSVKHRENKINKSGSSNRRRKLSVGNKSPASANHDSGSRGSREKMPKDQLNGKRRNSFGSVKPDHTDQEPKDNSSNNDSVPRFMKATESARAKINATSSPRSSPDVHEHDIHIKKRHSLPGATGRHDSPRIEQSPPQAQQATKGNGLHERKWQR